MDEQKNTIGCRFCGTIIQHKCPSVVDLKSPPRMSSDMLAPESTEENPMICPLRPLVADEPIALRDRFAMAALPKIIDSFEKFTPEQAQEALRRGGFAAGSPMEAAIASIAYRVADFMLEARKRVQENPK